MAKPNVSDWQLAKFDKNKGLFQRVSRIMEADVLFWGQYIIIMNSFMILTKSVGTVMHQFTTELRSFIKVRILFRLSFFNIKWYIFIKFWLCFDLVWDSYCCALILLMKVMALVDIRFFFPLNILDRIYGFRLKFAYLLILAESRLGLLRVNFHYLWLQTKFVSTQYLEQHLMYMYL